MRYDFDVKGSALQQVLGALYCLERLDVPTRQALAPVVRRAMRWRGPFDAQFLAYLAGSAATSLSALGDPLDGLNMCGAGKVVCLIDPIGDVYACPFAIHEEFLAGNIRDEGGFTRVWRESAKFQSMRETQPGGSCTSCSAFDRCRGGCMAAKFFTGLAMDDPDPECVFGHGEAALAMRQVSGRRPSTDHSKTRRAPTFVPLDVLTSRACDANPVGRP